MKRKHIYEVYQLTVLFAYPVLLFPSCTGKPAKPNIIFIFADDMGYGDVGCYGQQLIETPNMDKLAAHGKIFTNAYSASPVSASSRCGLLTGLHMGHAYIRGNDPWTERGDVWDYYKTSNNPSLEGQRPIPAETITIPELLKKQGYATGCFGKWGLGAPFTEGAPEKQGFDIFYGYNCQRQAHTYFPNHLWKNNERIAMNNEIIPPATRLPEGANIYDKKSYDFLWQQDYSAELIHNESLRFIEENANNPFFLFYSTTLPHTSLQAPERLVDKYVKKFGDEEPSLGGSAYPCRYPHATYAAMVTYLDEQIGEIIAKIKELGIYDNTLIVFSSDNGPAGDPNYFQSAQPFQSKSNRVKGSLYEGGIRSPFIAVWKDKIEAGTKSDLPIVLYDLLPTFCEISGAEKPLRTDGISFLPELLGANHQKRHEYLYWEHAQSGGQQAIRFGNWKGLRVNINSKANTKIMLFDLQNDLQETTDVSALYPEIVDKMEQYMSETRTKPEIIHFYLNSFDN